MSTTFPQLRRLGPAATYTGGTVEPPASGVRLTADHMTEVRARALANKPQLTIGREVMTAPTAQPRVSVGQAERGWASYLSRLVSHLTLRRV